MSHEEVYDSLMNYHQKLEQTPQELHLFCPRVNDDDFEDYENLDEPGTDVTVEQRKTEDCRLEIETGNSILPVPSARHQQGERR
jgi:senataxin